VLRRQIQDAEAAEAKKQEQHMLVVKEEAEELARLNELERDVEAKEAEAEQLEKEAKGLQEGNDALYQDMTVLKSERMALEEDLARLKGAIKIREEAVSPEVQDLQKQLMEALEVQGNLRYSLLELEDKSNETKQERCIAEARVAELRQRLEESRASYVEAIQELDDKVAALEAEAFDAERTAERLERALESTAFRTRMAALELGRFQQNNPAIEAGVERSFPNADISRSWRDEIQAEPLAEPRAAAIPSSFH